MARTAARLCSCVAAAVWLLMAIAAAASGDNFAGLFSLSPNNTDNRFGLLRFNDGDFNYQSNDQHSNIDNKPNRKSDEDRFVIPTVSKDRVSNSREDKFKSIDTISKRDYGPEGISTEINGQPRRTSYMSNDWLNYNDNKEKRRKSSSDIVDRSSASQQKSNDENFTHRTEKFNDPLDVGQQKSISNLNAQLSVQQQSGIDSLNRVQQKTLSDDLNEIQQKIINSSDSRSNIKPVLRNNIKLGGLHVQYNTNNNNSGTYNAVKIINQNTEDNVQYLNKLNNSSDNLLSETDVSLQQPTIDPYKTSRVSNKTNGWSADGIQVGDINARSDTVHHQGQSTTISNNKNKIENVSTRFVKESHLTRDRNTNVRTLHATPTDFNDRSRAISIDSSSYNQSDDANIGINNGSTKALVNLTLKVAQIIKNIIANHANDSEPSIKSEQLQESFGIESTPTINLSARNYRSANINNQPKLTIPFYKSITTTEIPLTTDVTSDSDVTQTVKRRRDFLEQNRRGSYRNARNRQNVTRSPTTVVIRRRLYVNSLDTTTQKINVSEVNSQVSKITQERPRKTQTIIRNQRVEPRLTSNQKSEIPRRSQISSSTSDSETDLPTTTTTATTVFEWTNRTRKLRNMRDHLSSNPIKNIDQTTDPAVMIFGDRLSRVRSGNYPQLSIDQLFSNLRFREEEESEKPQQQYPIYKSTTENHEDYPPIPGKIFKIDKQQMLKEQQQSSISDVTLDTTSLPITRDNRFEDHTFTAAYSVTKSTSTKVSKPPTNDNINNRDLNDSVRHLNTSEDNNKLNPSDNLNDNLEQYNFNNNKFPVNHRTTHEDLSDSDLILRQLYGANNVKNISSRNITMEALRHRLEMSTEFFLVPERPKPTLIVATTTTMNPNVLLTHNNCVGCSNSKSMAGNRTFNKFVASTSGQFLRREVWVVPILVLSIISMLLMVAFEIFVLCKASRTTPSRRHLFLGQMLLLGLFFCSALAAMLTVNPSLVTCATIRFGTGVAYALVFAALLVKCVFLISLNGGVYLPAPYQGLLLLFAVLIQVAIGAQWLANSPPMIDMVAVETSTQRHHLLVTAVDVQEQHFVTLCRTPYVDVLMSLIYVVFLILFVAILAIKSRGIRDNYRESTYIGLAIGFTIPIWLLWVMSGLIVVDKHKDGCIASGLVVTATTVFLVMFMPKGRQLAAMGKEGVYVEDREERFSSLSRAGSGYSPSFFHFKPMKYSGYHHTGTTTNSHKHHPTVTTLGGDRVALYPAPPSYTRMYHYYPSAQCYYPAPPPPPQPPPAPARYTTPGSMFLRPDDGNVYTTLEPTLSSNPNVYFQRGSGLHPGMMY